MTAVDHVGGFSAGTLDATGFAGRFVLENNAIDERSAELALHVFDTVEVGSNKGSHCDEEDDEDGEEGEDFHFVFGFWGFFGGKGAHLVCLSEVIL